VSSGRNVEPVQREGVQHDEDIKQVRICLLHSPADFPSTSPYQQADMRIALQAVTCVRPIATLAVTYLQYIQSVTRAMPWYKRESCRVLWRYIDSPLSTPSFPTPPAASGMSETSIPLCAMPCLAVMGTDAHRAQLRSNAPPKRRTPTKRRHETR